MKPILKKLLLVVGFLLCSLGVYAHDFYQDGIYYNKLSDNEIEVTNNSNYPDYGIYKGNVVIPENITYSGTTYRVTSISSNAFSNSSQMTTITIPNSITAIGEKAFWGCTGLSEITIPAYVGTIGREAFSGCRNLKTVNYNAESCSFMGNSSYYMFDHCCNLYIGSAVKFIPLYAFKKGAFLSSINVDINNTLYDSRENCNAIIETATNTLILGCQSTTIPNSITSISDYAFQNCTGLVELSIPNSVTSIGNLTFGGCTGLKEVIIPNSVTSIEEGAFNACGLTEITIPSSAVEIGSRAFNSCQYLTQVTIEKGLTSIPDNAFSYCPNLFSVTIPNSITSIHKFAFSGCYALKSITIPESVKELGLNDCSGLTEITCKAIIPPIASDDNSFYNVNKSIPVYVPAESVEAYRSAQYWSEFTNIVGYTEMAEGDKFTVDGIYYEITNIENSEVAVTFAGDSYVAVSGEYAGKVVIPETVTYQDATYSVTSIGDDAFFKCTGLAEIIIPNSVTSIGYSAFYECSGLTSVTIGNSVTSIGDWAFYGCDGLTEIIIPNSVTSIGDDAFHGCTGLTEIIIPNSVTSIGNYTFYRCDGLTEIIIPNSVTSIGNYTFYRCEGLIEVTIPNSVTSIGGKAFQGCDGLTEITIPSSVTAIEDNAFASCSVLESIIVETGNMAYDSRNNCNAIIETATNSLITGCKTTVIPDSITSIEYQAFRGCDGLTEITIPNSVTSIGQEAFSYCTGLTEITIPESVTSIGEAAFRGCTGLTSIRVEAVNPPVIAENTFKDIDKSIPLYVPAESVEGYRTAEYWSDFTNIVGYTELAEGDKFTVDGIHYQVLPESRQVAITYYGNDESNVPDEYKYTDTVTIPETVTYQGVTYSVIEIGDYAFYYCTGLTSVTIPNGVVEIGSHAFSGCTGLSSIVVEGGNTIYDSRDNCNAIIETATNTLVAGCKNTTIPNSVTSIGEYAFCGCRGLTEIIIPNSVTTIGEGAFYECSGLTSINIPNSVTSIGREAFSSCNDLETIIVEAGNVAYDSRNNCNAIIKTATNSLIAGCKTTIIPDSITSIGYGAFHYCTGLSEINIPNSVTEIGEWAFNSCTGLTSVTIGNSVTSIGKSAFYYCSGLTKIYVDATTPPTTSGAFVFAGVDKSIPLYVPMESVDAYRSANLWNQFTNIIGYTKLSEGDKFTVDGIHYQVLPESGLVAVTYYGDDKYNVPEEYIYKGVVTIPEAVTYQGVTYSVTEIGGSAFYYCTGLTEITIPNSVTSIGEHAFHRTGMREITIPNSVTSIGGYAFDDCEGLTDIFIPNNVTSIGNSAFADCAGLTSIVVEEGNTVYDSRENCNAIIETVSNTLIAGCMNTTIPNNVTSIGDYAFYGCTGLTEITIPNSVTSIGSWAFSVCTGLTEVTIPNSVTSIGKWAFWDCNNLISIVISESITEIETGVFTQCYALKEVAIPNGVTSIEGYAFYACYGLTSIVIPNSVTSIGDEVFYYCSGLTEMRVEAVNPPTIYYNTFREVDKSIPVYVPAESVEAYRTAEYWSEFTNILSIPVENPGEPSANRLQADDVTVAELDGVLSQARVALPIALVNEDAISAVQCDIYLPAGLSIATTESGMDIALSDRASESHTLMTRTLANGAVRIVIMSATAEALTGNEGTLFTLGLLPNENYNTESQIVIRNITMTDTDIVEYTPEQVVVNCRIRQSILGDANRDNKINVTDIVLLAKYILNDYHGDFDALAGDVNQDGKINVSDIVAMANKILSGEGAAGAPTRQEGEKGTLRMDEVQINGENSATASLMLDNSVSYSAFQMDVILPDGVEIAAIERSERISEHHQLMWKEQADGRVRILVFAIDNSVIAAQEGALFDMQLRAQSGFTAGELQVTDATFVTRGTTTHHIDDLAVGVSRTSDLTGNHVANRVYATGRTLVIESSEAQEARITTADGLSQSIALQPGRNEYPMTQQGVYIVTLGNENKKVIVK